MLTTILVLLIVLWLLARIRFGDQPPINPVPSVLGQLNVGARFDGLASEIDDLHPRLLPQLMTLNVPRAAATAGESRTTPAGCTYLALTPTPFKEGAFIVQDGKDVVAP